ncbi:MAG: THUMP domain-containing protein [Candidatus Woesearchaeota archaeon]
MPVLVRYDEIGIKGKNRARFENVLVRNIEANLRSNNVKFSEVRRAYGRIIIETDESCSSLKKVFGISSFSQATNAGKTIDEAAAVAKKLVESLSENDSFRVSCQRLDKKFSLTSHQACSELGSRVARMTKAKVRMENPSVNIQLEIIDGNIYVLAGRIEGPGGMPVGCQGVAVALVEDDDSVTAALLVMKRGCKIIPAVIKNAGFALIRDFSPEKIVQWNIKSVSELDEVCRKQKSQAVVVNDSFGKFREIPVSAVVLRPLSGFSPQEIKNERKKIESLA